MKPTVTIIYNVALAISSLTLLYGYFNHLVYEKEFSKEKQQQNVIHNPSDIEETNSIDSTTLKEFRSSILPDYNFDSLINNIGSSLQVNDSTTIANTKKEITTQPIDLSKAKKEKKKELVNFLDMLVVMFLAGMLGGVLANLRGLFEFYREEKGFPANLFIPYLIRPLTAAISGLLIFFISHLIISSTAPSYDNEHITFKGMVSFMSLAIISGFASQEFTERLKAAASTLFGISPNEASSVKPSQDPAEIISPLSNETAHPPVQNPAANPPTDSDAPQVSTSSIATTQQRPEDKRYINRD